MRIAATILLGLVLPLLPSHSTAQTPDAVPESREASGTSWQPDASPMFALHKTTGPWTLMFHENVYGQFLHESGTPHHSATQAGSINWFMGMAHRPIGNARLGIHAMMSLEPWTIGGCGYPDSLATGEICDTDSIHDRQHPHDLFMELAAHYDRPLTPTLRWQIYGGVAGEPALGPPAFPHRVSAFPNPVAPIAHHWLDATHITFGVVTGGVYSKRWKVEGSLFNGREPDETRTNIDLAALDSFSGRLNVAVSSGLTAQISAGHLTESEAGLGTQPRTDKNRFTASAIYQRGSAEGRLWSTTIAYGMNSGREIDAAGPVDQTTHAMLVESSAILHERHAVFGRVEVVGKPAHELHAHEFEPRVFKVGKIQTGYVRYLKPWKGFVPGVGASLSMSLLPPELAPRYNGEVAPGVGFFVTVRPAAMTHGSHAAPTDHSQHTH